MYDDPKLQALKDFLLIKRKLSIFTVKDILAEVKKIYEQQSK